MDQRKSYPTWPVIVNKVLETTDFVRIFHQYHMKVRVSNSTLANTVIFPLSGVAFMILSLKDEDDSMSPELEQKIHKFTHIHKVCYILVLAALHGQKETDLYEEIQLRFLDTKLQMMPIHNAIEGVQAMVTMAKALCKPESEAMYEQLSSCLNRQPMSDVMSFVLQQGGLNEHQIGVIQDGLGSLSNLANATEEDMQDCSLDKDTITKIQEIFNAPVK